MTHPIKKATDKVAYFIKRIQQLNFKSEQEVIEVYQICGEMDFHEGKRRRGRFEYYLQLLGLEEAYLFDELTEKQAEQYSAIWKLVDLEGGLYE